jgi:hypothetical protein
VFLAKPTALVTEWWRGRLWSAQHHWVVRASTNGLVTYAPPGTRGTYASSRGVPGRENLTRAERKLETLRSCAYTVVDIEQVIGTLNFFVDGSWARVNLGWDVGGTFLGWYVNFEVPPRVTADGVATMDLVLDAVITPERQWQPKDQDDFDRAVAEGLLDRDHSAQLARQAAVTRRQAAEASGPFAQSWTSWKPSAAWGVLELPSDYAVGGTAWNRQD